MMKLEGKIGIKQKRRRFYGENDEIYYDWGNHASSDTAEL